MTTDLSKQCERCRKKFFKEDHRNFKTKRFCSYSCSAYSRDRSACNTRQTRNCVVCKTEYKRGHRTEAQWANSTVCSLRCHHKSQVGAKRLMTPKWREKCRNNLRNAHRRGAAHWNWQGGITPALQLLRHSPEYNEWRKAVYRRDNWTCQMCHVKQKHPIAHHLKSFRHYPALRFDVENGQTLCRSCHKIIHSEIGVETRFVAA
jgi:hypothetical protein